MRTDDLHRLTGAYALDALDEDERRFFEAHLEDCDACRAEVAEFHETAARLGVAAAEEPPAELRDKIMAAIDTTRQERPVVVDIDRAGGAGSWMRRLAAPAAAVLAVIVVGLSVILGNVNARVDELENQVAAFSHVMAAPDARVEQVRTDGGGSARVVVSASRSEAAFFAEGLEPVAADQAYALWLIQDGEATPAGLFTPGEDGRATRLMTGDMRSVEAIGVTVEPASGSPQPTSDPLILLEV